MCSWYLRAHGVPRKYPPYYYISTTTSLNHWSKAVWTHASMPNLPSEKKFALFSSFGELLWISVSWSLSEWHLVWLQLKHICFKVVMHWEILFFPGYIGRLYVCVCFILNEHIWFVCGFWNTCVRIQIFATIICQDTVAGYMWKGSLVKSWVSCNCYLPVFSMLSAKC